MRDIDWAKNEIELALKSTDNPSRKKCYKIILKIFKLLNDDRFAWGEVGYIRWAINALFNRYPLTPIEDNDDEWVECFGINENPPIRVFQHKRRGSLWKDILPDRRIIYKDNERTQGIDINSNNPYYSWVTSEIVNEMFPITFPYTPPEKPCQVFAEDFLFDKSKGDFDTKYIYYIITPEGEKIEVNRIFNEDDRGRMREISIEEFNKMKERREIENEQ